MNFLTAIKTVYSKFGVFSGRATRPEFWWFFLYSLAVNLGLDFLLGETIGNLWALVHLLPTVAVNCRRLHDTDRSGWWQTLPVACLPIFLLAVNSEVLLYAGIALILALYMLLIVWWASSSTPGDNRFGPDPHGNTDAEIWSSPGLMDTFRLMKESVFYAENEEPVPNGI